MTYFPSYHALPINIGSGTPNVELGSSTIRTPTTSSPLSSAASSTASPHSKIKKRRSVTFNIANLFQSHTKTSATSSKVEVKPRRSRSAATTLLSRSNDSQPDSLDLENDHTAKAGTSNDESQHQLSEARRMSQRRRVKTGEVKLVTIASSPKKQSPATTPKPQTRQLPTPPSSAKNLPPKKLFTSPVNSPSKVQIWKLPSSAKVFTQEAIEKIDQLFSQVAVFEPSQQVEDLTAALLRTQVALMKKLQLKGFQEYMELEVVISQELKMVKNLQAELRILKEFELEIEKNKDGEDF